MLFTLCADPALNVGKGSFGARLNHQARTLALPPDVHHLAKALRADTAAGLYAELCAHPNVAILGFAWTRSDFDAAMAELKALLRGQVPDAVLDPPPASTGEPPPDGFEE
jgi:hypothetical protein